MKIVMINGQNHKGSTYHIGKLLIEELGDTNEITEFFLPRDLNHFCLGCYSCVEDETKCPFYEEKNRIMMKVEEADLLIFTTPNYCMAPSAPMKAFIDLTFTYWISHKPRACMYSKKAVVLSTTAGIGTGKAMEPIARTLSYWGISDITKYGVSVQAMNWEMIPEKIKGKIQKKVKSMAKKLSKNSPSRVTFKTKLMFTMLAGMQKANMGASKTERKYWEDKGWLGKDRPWKK